MFRNQSSFGVVKKGDRLGERVQWLDHSKDGLIIGTQFLIRAKIFLFLQAPRQAVGSLGSGATGGEISLTLPSNFEVKYSRSSTSIRKQGSQSAAMPFPCPRTHWRVSYTLNSHSIGMIFSYNFAVAANYSNFVFTTVSNLSLFIYQQLTHDICKLITSNCNSDFFKGILAVFFCNNSKWDVLLWLRFFSTLTEVFSTLNEVFFFTLTEGFPCLFLSCKANARV